MTFSLTNAPATLHSYTDDYLRPYIDDFVLCSLYDILILSANEKEYEEHVRQMLQRLKEFGLYCKAKKCQFGVLEVGFLVFVLTPDGVGMESDRISTIEDLLTPQSVCDVLELLGYTNFYRRFIRKYAQVTFPVPELLKKAQTFRGTKSEGSAKWESTREAELALGKLKRTFTKARILQHFDPAKLIIVQTDASVFAIAGFHNQ